MKEEQLERALLGYLSSDSENPQLYRSLTTVFEQLSRPREWRSSYFDQLESLDDKESVREFLDQMVADGLLESKVGERGYENSYRLTDQGIYEVSGFGELVAAPLPNALLTEAGEPLETENGEFLEIEDPLDGSDIEPPVAIDSSAWTGLSKVIIDAKNATVISGLIDQALAGLPSSDASNFQIMQATAYLRAAKALVDAPEPPSQEIWKLVGKAADIVGLLSFFYAIFAEAMN